MARRGSIVNADGYSKAVAVNPGPTALADGPTDALYVGAAGDVTVTMLGGQSTTFAVTAGIVLPIRVTHVTVAAAGEVVALHW